MGEPRCHGYPKACSITDRSQSQELLEHRCRLLHYSPGMSQCPDLRRHRNRSLVAPCRFDTAKHHKAPSSYAIYAHRLNSPAVSGIGGSASVADYRGSASASRGPERVSAKVVSPPHLEETPHTWGAHERSVQKYHCRSCRGPPIA